MFENEEYCFRTILGAIQHFESIKVEDANAEMLEESDAFTDFTECKP